MINAVFDRDGDVLTLSMRGHANYVDGRSDIVCAAVSGIFYSLLGYLVNCTEGTVINSIKHGYAMIECGLDGVEAMRQTLIGLLQIQNTYPECVKVTDKAKIFAPTTKKEVTF